MQVSCLAMALLTMSPFQSSEMKISSDLRREMQKLFRLELVGGLRLVASQQSISFRDLPLPSLTCLVFDWLENEGSKFPEILSLVLVTETWLVIAWSLVVSGFMDLPSTMFRPDSLWAEMTRLDRWKSSVKMWEISIKIISQDLPRKIDLWSGFMILQETLLLTGLFAE